MINGSLTVYEYIEDYDNPGLFYDARIERLKDAVEFYNQEYGTSYSPEQTVYKYFQSKQNDL